MCLENIEILSIVLILSLRIHKELLKMLLALGYNLCLNACTWEIYYLELPCNKYAAWLHFCSDPVTGVISVQTTLYLA